MTTYVSAPFSFQLQSNTPTGEAEWKQSILNIHDALIGCGMVDNNDTGSTDLSTITRGASANQVRGTRMYRFNDSRQGVDPIFVKIEYTNGNNIGNQPCLWFTVGQGSDGALTLTGQTSSRIQTGSPSVNTNETPLAQNYYCHTEGYFGAFGRRVATSNPNSLSVGTRTYEAFTITRTRDASYNFDGRGVLITADSAYSAKMFSNQFVRFASPATLGGFTTQGCLVTGLPANSALLNGDKQLYPHFFYDPGFGIEQSWSTFTIVAADYAQNPVIFNATPIAAGGSRTFLFLGDGYAQWGDPNGSSAYRIATLWE
jgi:hypothetical protein